ncbi:hypothetical protein [Maridesulfovibrio sp.]|uniref:hypothetical protein n=1 Tax=Maridesulfovibrio sp. TaxID=2795000 RepID=UPI002A18D6C7|nr:hypothetical protein [Maridesulfovibrio sp.]
MNTALLLSLGLAVLCCFRKFKFKKILSGAVKVFSSSSGKTYYVDPVQLSCSCSDWKKCRAGFSQDDPRRLCKHLINSCVGQDKIPTSLSLYDEALHRFYDNGWEIPADEVIKKVDSPQGEIAYFKDCEDDVWYNVCFQGKRYGWLKEQNCWCECTPENVKDVLYRAINGVPDD